MIRVRKRFITFGGPLLVSVITQGAVLHGQTSNNNATRNGVAPDNSKVNERATEVQKKTAGDQSGSKSDEEITRRIRRSITSDSSLSTYAHNIKIITIDGGVLLKGPVRTAEEKGTVIALAIAVAGDKNVKSELAVVSK